MFIRDLPSPKAPAQELHSDITLPPFINLQPKLNRLRTRSPQRNCWNDTFLSSPTFVPESLSCPRFPHQRLRTTQGQSEDRKEDTSLHDQPSCSKCHPAPYSLLPSITVTQTTTQRSRFTVDVSQIVIIMFTVIIPLCPSPHSVHYIGDIKTSPLRLNIVSPLDVSQISA